MNKKNAVRVLPVHGTLTVLLLICFAHGTQAAEPAAVAVEVFKGPKAIRTPGPAYPESERVVGNEGWVHVNFMIDPRGKPYEVAVVESTGNKAFEKAAVSAVEKWTFEPATGGGTPIHAGQDYKVLFHMNAPATGASKQFVRAYRNLIEAIASDDRTRADEELSKLKVQNLYEDAYLNLGKYNYHLKWGSESEQLHDLRRAIAHETGPRYLRKEAFVIALTSLLALELKAQDIARALKTWEKLRPIAPREHIERWQVVIDQVQELRKSDRAFRLSAQMDEGTSWYGELFKNRFEVVVLSGKVSDIKLRCEKQYLFFRHEPGLQYKVDAPSGNCSIELIGEPGTKFDLIQI